jgi:hypothetical protein
LHCLFQSNSCNSCKPLGPSSSCFTPFFFGINCVWIQGITLLAGALTLKPHLHPSLFIFWYLNKDTWTSFPRSLDHLYCILSGSQIYPCSSQLSKTLVMSWNGTASCLRLLVIYIMYTYPYVIFHQYLHVPFYHHCHLWDVLFFVAPSLCHFDVPPPSSYGASAYLRDIMAINEWSISFPTLLIYILGQRILSYKSQEHPCVH